MTRNAESPSGTVTFLFTDIEGSTQRWEAHRDAMRQALERHNAILHAAIAAHRGYVFKTVGDEFCAAFWNPVDAAGAAIEAQRALCVEDFGAVGGLRVRMAIHCGIAAEREGDYFGPTVNRVARLLAAAHGGQMLVSQVAAELLAGSLPEGTVLRDLGAHRLRDLPRPEAVFQLTARGLRDAFPPLRSTESNPSNLPLQLTSFLGRQEEVTEIEAVLREARLVTLVGAGGVGKTRAALEVATRSLPEYPDGVWFVDLAPLVDPQLVAAAIAAVFNVRPVESRPLIDEIVLTLKPKRLLVVLDNCEQVVDGAARVAEPLLHRCPDLRILATSREPLNVTGEHSYRMPSLPEGTAIELFAERARAVQGRFELTEQNRPIVAEIVRRLDGIALAIELAASRVKILGVRGIAKGLDERFKLLTGGSRTALPRQQTLHALIGWSYDLLSEQEKSMLRQLAIFRGGWTLEAATDVCIDERFPDWDALLLLESLIEKSLVIAEPIGDESRYRMLESTREFAVQRLREAGEQRALSARHCAYFVRESERRFEDYWRTNREEWHAANRWDMDNYRAAIRWSLEDGNDLESGALLVANLSYAQISELPDMIVRAGTIAKGALSEPVRGRLALALARTLSSRRSFLEYASDAVAIFEQAGSPAELAEAFMAVGAALYYMGRIDALGERVERTLALARDCGLARLLADVQASVGGWLSAMDETERARDLFEEAIGTLRGLGDWGRLSRPLMNLAEVLFRTGDPLGAVSCAREALALAVQAGNPYALVVCHLNIAAYLLSQDRASEAWSHVREGLAGAIPRGLNLSTAIGIGHLAEIAARENDFERAARLQGYVDSFYARLEFERELTERRGYERTMAMLRAALPEERLVQLLSEGAALDVQAAVAQAMDVPRPAEVVEQSG